MTRPFRLAVAVAAVTAAIAASAPAHEPPDVPREPEPTRRFQIIGHRGAPASAPENTLVGFRTAFSQGATMVELDVRLSAPDRRERRTIVVIHDSTLDRTTNCAGAVAKTAWTKIAGCDAGYGMKDPRDRRWVGKGVRVPSLPQVFASFPRSRLNIEIKGSATGSAGPLDLFDTARELGAYLRARAERDRTLFSRIVVSSLDQRALQVVEAIEPRAVTALVTSSSSDTVLTGAARTKMLLHDVAVPSVRAADLSRETVRAMQDAGDVVWVHTANASSTIRRMLSYGVNGIYTDYPERVRAALRRPASSSRTCVMSICI